MRTGTRTTIALCAVAMLAAGSLKVSAEESTDKITLRAVTPKQFNAVLEKSKGKVVLIDFWATSCRPCRAQFPHTVALQKKLADRGLFVISMSCDDEDSHEEALKFLVKSKSNLLNLRSTLGASDETYSAYDIDSGALPHYKLYDREGKLRKTFAVDPTAKKQFTTDDIDAAVEELLTEK